MNIIERKFIFDGDITANECHASTVVVLDDETVVAAWFAGTAEGKSDVCIWCCRRTNGIWSKPVRITDNDGIPHWNPVLFSDDGSTVTLFYKVGSTIPNWKTFVIRSYNKGESWSAPEELVQGDCSGGRGPVKNKPLTLSNGKILAPASVERGPWRCFADVFDGNMWRKRSIPVDSKETESLSVIQPTVWESSNGIVHALMRSNKGRIYRSDSDDYGENWSCCYPINIPNNNSGIDATVVGKRLLLVCNPVEKNWGLRSPLTLFISDDNGISFKKLIDIETEDGEFSYPSIVEKKEKIYIVYTYKRRKIAFCELCFNGGIV